MEEEGERGKRIKASQLEDVLDLFHRIQSMFPLKDAGRTCVLSKTWLYAWSTIPTLRFRLMFPSTSEQQRQYLNVVDRTLLSYLQENIPIETFDLHIGIDNQELASLVEKWLRQVATKTSLKDISLFMIFDTASFTLLDEIFSWEKLKKITVMGSIRSKINPLWKSSNSIIKCVSLRVLVLVHLHISSEVLNNLLSTCSLLEKIYLEHCMMGLNTIKVKTLRYLSEFSILPHQKGGSPILEIDDVPNLCKFYYNSTSLFLGSLTLEMTSWCPKNCKITCPMLKRLIISRKDILLNLQVLAPKLFYFQYNGSLMPTLVFSANAPKVIEINIDLTSPIDVSFFIKIRETLMLSSTFYIQIYMPTNMPLNMDIDDLKRRVSYPATNVRQLRFQTVSDKGSWEHSPFFDAFFEICHPERVVGLRDLWLLDNNYLCKLMVKEVMEKKSRKGEGYWPDYLKDVEIFNRENQKWEKLTDSWKSFLDGLSTQVSKVAFKLYWY